jgi:hypothetical protein
MSQAYRGDEVFFHHKGNPCVGKVLSTGRHGCTIEHEGKQHRVKWDKIAGHKSRVPQTYRILHDGDDGLIVENQDGKRRFLNIPPESRAERLELDPQKKTTP